MSPDRLFIRKDILRADLPHRRWPPFDIPTPVETPLQRRIWEAIRASTPAIKLSDVRVVHLPNALDDAKVKMNSVGVTALDQVGNLRLTGNLRITQGASLIANRQFIEDRGLHAIPHVMMPIGIQMAKAAGNQRESVILADELDLTNKTIEIDRKYVSHLFIIARKIKAMSGAKITYRPLVNPNPGKRGNTGRNGTSFDRNNSHNKLHHAPNGGSGRNGENGLLGPDGVDAPYLNIYVLEMDGIPDIILPGQKGGQGGRGGKGGKGGDGERGRNSKRNKYRTNCKNGPGYGGHGGNGGDVGKGGKGGTGGDGSNILIATLEENIVDTEKAWNNSLYNISAGKGGDPGAQGDFPGKRGLGGLPGKNTAGFPCKSESGRGGKDGQDGKTEDENWNPIGNLGSGDHGSVGEIEFNPITREEWELELDSPWITTISPNTGFPGREVDINGQHFVKNSKVYYEKQEEQTSTGTALNPEFLSDEKLKFTVPIDTQHGENCLYVITPDNDTSNSVPFHVQPQVDIIEMDGIQVTSVSPGNVIKIRGRAFSSEASIYYRKEWLSPDSVEGNHTITLTLPTIEGENDGGETYIQVQNEDGLKSDKVKLLLLPTRDSGFRANPNGFAFENFKHGDPSWRTFRATFGTEEIVKEAIRHPILLGAFYIFYTKYLNGDLDAHKCTGISGTSLRRFHEGVGNLYGAYPVSTASPPPISGDLMRELVIAQGRLLSKELLIHYAVQGQEGIDRIARTIRDIEADFDDLRGVSTARTLSFIPSGNVWDSGYYDRLKESHCVVPTRIVYPDRSKNLHGARLQVYDCNYPDNDSRVIELFVKNDGKLHFRYHDEFSSEDGFTLGTANLKLALLDDVDLPFSGPFGTGLFTLDVLASPAWLRIEANGGGLLGYKDGKIYTDPNLGYVSPFVPNYILTNAEHEKSFKRVIHGFADGKYDFMSFHPNGKSVTLEDVDVNANTRDMIEISSDFSRMQIANSDPDKEFRLHLGEKIEEGIRIASAGFVIKQNEVVSLDVRPGMSSIALNTPNRDIQIELDIRSIIKTEVADFSQPIDLASNENLRIDVGDWSDLVRSISFKKII